MKQLRTRIGILSMCFLSMSALVITSALSAIIADFPHESVAKIQMIATIPSFGTLITTILVGILAVHLPKKLLALIGVFFVALGGLLPLVWHSSVDGLLLCALLLGIGLGFTNPVYPMLIAMYFDGDERAATMGQSTAINSLGSIVMMLIGAFLGAQNWVHAYYSFFVAIIIFLLILFLLPMDQVVHADTAQQGGTLQLLKHLNKYVFIVSGIGLMMSLIYTIYPTNLSLIVASKQLGGTSITGVVNAVGTIGGFVAGFSMKGINKLVKDKALPVGFCLLALTFLLIRVANNLPVVFIGAVLSGFAMAIVMSTVPFYVSVVSKPIQIALSMTVFQFGNALGGVFTPIILSALHISYGNAAFSVGAVASLVMAGVCVVSGIGKRVLGCLPPAKAAQVTE